MVYLFVLCIVECLTLIIITTYFQKEREKLIELLAAKDYADYKAFENTNEEAKSHKNMFTRRSKNMEIMIEKEE